MVTLHEVITFLVSMLISISSLQTHNVNRCGRSRHLGRKLSLFFFNDTATTEIYTLSLHDALPMYPAEPPVPSLVVEDGLEQVTPRDVGPEDRRDVQLGVGELPQQEIGEPAFAGRPDQKVRVAPGRRIELGANGVLVDVLESLDALE